MMALLLGLFSTDLLANDMSAVTLVMDILKHNDKCHLTFDTERTGSGMTLCVTDTVAHLPSNRCFRKSNSAFCIISVTYNDESGRRRWQWKGRRIIRRGIKEITECKTGYEQKKRRRYKFQHSYTFTEYALNK